MIASAERCPTVREIPGRSDAERALAAAQHSGRHLFPFAVAFLCEQVPAMLDNCDCIEADKSMLAFLQDLDGQLPAGDHIFRWTGTSLLVLMWRSGTFETVQREINTIVAAGKRCVFSIQNTSTPEQLYRQIDFFVAMNL